MTWELYNMPILEIITELTFPDNYIQSFAVLGRESIGPRWYVKGQDCYFEVNSRLSPGLVTC